MPYAFTRELNLEHWNITNKTGETFYCAAITGTLSGATGILLTFAVNFGYQPIGASFIRTSVGNFLGNETVNISNGAAVVGTFRLAAAATAAWVDPIIIVTGSDTANVFEAVAAHSNAMGWGYEVSAWSKVTLNCGVMIGDPRQVAVTSAVSKSESVIVDRNWWVAGNVNFNSLLAVGVGTVGDYYSSKYGSTISCNNNMGGPGYISACGPTRYGELIAHDSSFNIYNGGWKQTLQRCSFWDKVAGLTGSMNIFMPGTFSSNVTDIAILRDVTGAEQSLYGHIYPDYADVILGEGIILSATGDFEMSNVDVLATSTDYMFGWLCSGYKTLTNCLIDPQSVNGFWSGFITYHEATVNIRCITPDGDPIPNVRVRAWDGTQNIVTDVAKFDALTAAGGSITEQQIRYAISGYPTPYSSLDPFTFFLNKIGWKETVVVQTIDPFLTDGSGAITWVLTLENVDVDSAEE